MIHAASFLGWKLLLLLLLALMASSNDLRPVNKGRLCTILRCWNICHLICNLISLLSLLALMVSSDDRRHVSKGRLCTILYCWNICHLICNLISHCSQFAFLDFVASLNIGASIVLWRSKTSWSRADFSRLSLSSVKLRSQLGWGSRAGCSRCLWKSCSFLCSVGVALPHCGRGYLIPMHRLIPTRSYNKVRPFLSVFLSAKVSVCPRSC